MSVSNKTDVLKTKKISLLMLEYSIPCVISLFVSSLYNISDQIFIGNSSIGTVGNAAVGIVFPLFVISLAFSWCFGDGCAAFLNICLGKKDSANVHKAIGTGIVITLLTSFLIMGIFFPLEEEILRLFGATDNSMGYALEYYRIILLFFPVCMLSNMMTAVIRADGSPAYALITMCAGAVVNILLSLLFIVKLDMGMFGAGLSTGIGQTVSFLASSLYFLRPKNFSLTAKSFIPDFKIFKTPFVIGLSSFVTQITIVAISLVCNSMLVKYGADSKYDVDILIAVISIESKVFTVVINLVVGIVLGCQPIVSYNMGAGAYDRVIRLYKNLFIACGVIGALATFLFELFPRNVMGLFGTPDASVDSALYWEFGEKTFTILLSSVAFTCIIKMSSVFFQSVGSPAKSTLISVVRDVLVYIPMLFVLPTVTGNVEALLFSAPIADAVGGIITVIFTVPFIRELSAKKKQTISE